MAPVQTNLLAPGDSTVVELIFNTKTSRGRVSKNARVLSSDSTKSSINISFSAFVVPDSDTASQIAISPAILEFTGEQGHQTAVMVNRGKSNISIEPVFSPGDEVTLKVKDKTIKSGKSGKIEFEWKGETPEYDLNQTFTFEASGAEVPRFSIPYLIKGEKGTRPPPQKPHVEQKTATSSKTPDQPKVTTEKGMKSISKYPIPTQPAAVSDKKAQTAKTDSTANKPNLPASQWPPQ